MNHVQLSMDSISITPPKKAIISNYSNSTCQLTPWPSCQVGSIYSNVGPTSLQKPSMHGLRATKNLLKQTFPWWFFVSSSTMLPRTDLSSSALYVGSKL
jgi:hypothetical protein